MHYKGSYSYRDRSRKKRYIIIGVIAVCSVTLILGATLGWYYNRKGKKDESPKVPDNATTYVPTGSVPTTYIPTASVPITSIPTASVPITSGPTASVPITSGPTASVPLTSGPTTTEVDHVCSYIHDKLKFDCYPDAPVNEINETECINRGCCFSEPKDSFPSASPPLNVPYCYYPSNYGGYSIKDVKKYDPDKGLTLMEIHLQRVRQSGFLKDSLNVIVLISYIDNNSLRIKIADADSKRYEVPVRLHYEIEKLDKPLYNVSLDDVTGMLSVSRSNSSSVIFKTNLLRLVFSDQFLQLSSDLPSSYVYGIGEHYENVLRDVNWSRFTLLNSDLSPIPNHALYGSHPFYMALETDGKASGVFLLNSNVMDVILQPTPAITFRPIGGILDFYIMMGPTPNDVSRQFSNIVGKTFMPPFWSLGFHLCRWGYNSLNKTKEAAERTISARIPFDVQWNDIDYMGKYKDFTYDKVNFAGLPEFVDELHSKGMHYVLMMDPALSNNDSYIPYQEGIMDDLFIKDANDSILVGQVWPGDTVYPDFSHPNATPFWTKLFENLYDHIKYDGVWIDMNEPSNFYNGSKFGCPDSPLEHPQYLPGGNLLSTKTLCMTAKHYSSIHYNEHNIYGYREAIATNEALKSIRKKRPFIITRASFSGQGVYSGHWSGDIYSSWEDMRYTIRSMINFNLYAVPMIGSDICGFKDNATVDLCARWQALGAFYPFSRNHNSNDTKEQDPVIMGPIVEQATRTALMKRYTLLPYLYTLFYKSHVFGDTVIRPLFMEFPEDKKTYDKDEQFLWGSHLLIAQVLYPNTSTVDVYFPKGLWYDSVTGHQITSSGEIVQITVPKTDIHLRVRGGAILTSQVPAMTTTESRKNPFTLAVALDEQKQASGELYWDDGDSLDTYNDGHYNLFKFQANKTTLNSTVITNGYKTDMNLQGINVIGYGDFPSKVTVNGHQCSYTDNPESTLDAKVADKISSFSSAGFLGFGKVRNIVAEDDFCVFFQIEAILMIQTKPVSLLSELVATWE